MRAQTLHCVALDSQSAAPFVYGCASLHKRHITLSACAAGVKFLKEFCLKTVLVIDESGAKGFSKKGERYKGEVGLMSGYIFPEESLPYMRDFTSNLFSNISSDGKLHLTDLTSEQQEKARSIVYDLFLSNSTCWFFEAISVEGFFQSVHDKDRSGSGVNELLHAKLFAGIFSKAIDRLKVSNPSSIHISVITDTISETTKKQFQSEVASYIELSAGNNVKGSFTSYDRDTNIVTKFETESSVTFSEANVLEILELEIKCEDTPLTFIADILANSAYYHVKNNLSKDPMIKPNSSSSIKGHPLSDLAHGAYNSDAVDVGSFSDLVYRRD